MPQQQQQQQQHLCVLMADTEGCEYDENDPPADLAQHLQRAGSTAIDVEVVSLTPHNYAATLIALARRFEKKEIDCFINLCDGAWDEPSVGIQIVDLLENKLNLPFTGAGMSFFEPTRIQMKQVALACGVNVPAWRFVYNNTDLQKLLAEYYDSAVPSLEFPLLVKHFSSYASVGLTKQSKVYNVQDLEEQCQRMLTTYGGCLVEEFIIGREFTILVAQEPGEKNDKIEIVAYDPVECHFGPGEDFKHYNLKWIDFDNIGWANVDDEVLAERLKNLSRRVFAAIGGRGYGRLDVRSDPTGEKLYFLEINPNCGVFYPEGFYGSADFILDKMDPIQAHATFVLNQVEVARRLWEKRNSQVCEAQYRGESWGIFATKDLKVGDLIFDLEEKPMYAVSKQHVLKKWQKHAVNDSGDFDMRNWENFVAYCWPLADELFGMWSPEPNDWRPINHSCDPNCWLEADSGLNVVARKNILAGEEICMDYATFTGYFPEMKSFSCACKSPNCRKTITGQDILKEELACKYYGHMTSYITTKAREYHGDKLNGLNGSH